MFDMLLHSMTLECMEGVCVYVCVRACVCARMHEHVREFIQV